MNDEIPNTIRLRYAKFVLAFSMFVMGACGMIYEYALGVLGNNLMGSSHEQLFVVIGIMMFAMGLGATVQQNLVKNLIDRFLVVELLLGLFGGISTLVIFCCFAYTDSYRVVMYAFATMIGMLIGCEIPLLIRINTTYSTSLRTNLSQILSMDYVGSLVGALLFAYVLLTRLSVERISLVLGCVNALIGLCGVIYFWPLVKQRVALIAASVATLLILIMAMQKSNDWMARLEQRCFEDPIVYRETTKYQHLVLTKKKDHVRLYIDGHLQFSSQDEFIYHEMLVHTPMSLAKQNKRVLILGGGDGLALRDVLRYSGVQHVTLVDIDPAMIEMARNNADLIHINRASFHDARVHQTLPVGISSASTRVVSARTKRDPILDSTEYQLAEVDVITVDADLFLREVEQQYDVVLIDFPDPRSIELAKLYSVPFYKNVSKRLAPRGIIAIQSTSPTNSKHVFSCIRETLIEADLKCIPYHIHVPSFGDWGWHLVWNDARTHETIRDTIDKLEHLPVETRFVTPDVIKSSFVFGKTQLQTDRPIRPNTRLNPVVMHYHSHDYR